MDPWQTSVEKRLDSLDRRAEGLLTTMTDVSVRLARVETKISELPTQTWFFKAMAGTIAAMGVVTAVIVRFMPPAG